MDWVRRRRLLVLVQTRLQPLALEVAVETEGRHSVFRLFHLILPLSHI